MILKTATLMRQDGTTYQVNNIIVPSVAAFRLDSSYSGLTVVNYVVADDPGGSLPPPVVPPSGDGGVTNDPGGGLSPTALIGLAVAAYFLLKG